MWTRSPEKLKNNHVCTDGTQHNTYEENRFRIRPDGVVSKKDMGLRKIFIESLAQCTWQTIVSMAEVWSTYAVCHTLMQLPGCLLTCISSASGRIARASTRSFVQMQIRIPWERTHLDRAEDPLAVSLSDTNFMPFHADTRLT